jgi:glycosyltransferase involved in cell wall biosynthesis
MGRKLRLLQLVHGYPPAIGGVEFAVRDICERLVARHGMEVTVFTTNAYTNANFLDGSLPTIPIMRDEEQNGVRVRRFPVVTRWSRPLRILQRAAFELSLPGNDQLRTWYQGPLCPDMRRATEEFDADVVCAASFPLNHMNYAFSTSPRRPVVLIGAVHTNDPWGYRRRNLLRLIDRSFATVSFTHHEREWLIEHGAPSDRVRVLGLGIEPDSEQAHPAAFRATQGIDPNGYLVAYVGQQGGHKGIETLIETLPRLLVHQPDSWLVVAGSRTPYSHHLRELQASMSPHAAARFRLVDDLSEQEKIDLLSACDVFASPSGHESFGITTLEAWARSKPVVLGDGPAQRSVVDPEVTGLLVPYRDGERLLGALVRLGSDTDLRRRLGEAGRAVVLQKYTIDHVADEYLRLFQEAAAVR